MYGTTPRVVLTTIICISPKEHTLVSRSFSSRGTFAASPWRFWGSNHGRACLSGKMSWAPLHCHV
ncbi:hypothetical protein CCMA1212_000328 [Trichoderma ghanense]|uniref:Uncharacterized protein n=1 Tax=Trichoderma ghanense TaxID=65468 RepID=A0ABY2HH12_9HYPO